MIDKASTLHGPLEEQVPKFQQIIADAAPKGDAKPEVKAAEAIGMHVRKQRELAQAATGQA